MSNAIHSKSIAYGILRALGLIFGILVLLWFLWEIQSVIIYIGFAAVISLIGRPIVIFLRNTLKFHNTLAVIVTLSILFSLIIGIILMIIPIIKEQRDNFKRIDFVALEANIEVLNVQISEYFGIPKVNVMERLQNSEYYQDFNMGVVPEFVNGFFGTLGSFGIGLFSILFITFFLLKDSRLLLEGVLVFSKKGTEGQFLRAFTKIKQLLSRYFIGLIFQILIIFILYSILLFIVSAENALIIAFFCALLNLVPYLGPAIGYVIMSALVISGNLGSDFSVVILPKLIIIIIGYGIVQTIDNFINQPLIFGKSVKSHPLEIFIIILIAGLLFGILGLVLAVPTYTAIKVISQEFLSEYKIVKKLTQNL
jgi:predicted PurR-regulated permease PerM